ncbi:unnamed protein product [Leptosia nina]|uniref:Uncharacterized protein n=1 Tax=Leptosia nina TaxID=320188 RepID=A0AAV1J7D1_9NEOP
MKSMVLRDNGRVITPAALPFHIHAVAFASLRPGCLGSHIDGRDIGIPDDNILPYCGRKSRVGTTHPTHTQCDDPVR